MRTDGNTSSPHSTDSVSSGSDIASNAIDVVQVLEERLTVTKRVVDSGGGVRLRKVVHKASVEVAEPLAIETLEVKRVSINREVEGPVMIRYEGDTTVFPILEERLVTRKQLVLIEEVHVTKRSTTDRTSNPITLRREEVIIERQDPQSGEWTLVVGDEPKSL